MNLTQVEAEIKKWQAKVEELAQAKETLQTKRQEMEAERKTYALKAVEGNDSDTKEKLQGSKRQLWELVQEEEDLAIALEGVQAKLTELERVRQEAIWEQLMAQLRKTAKERFALAIQIQEHIDAAAEVMDQYYKVGREMYSMAHSMGLPSRHLLPTKRLFGFLCYRLHHIFPVDMPRAAKFDERPLVEAEKEILKDYLEGDKK